MQRNGTYRCSKTKCLPTAETWTRRLERPRLQPAALVLTQRCEGLRLRLAAFSKGNLVARRHGKGSDARSQPAWRVNEGADLADLERDDDESAEMEKARQALPGWHRTGWPPKHSTAGACESATGKVLKRFPNVVSKDRLRTPHLTFDVRGGPPAGRPLDGGVSHHRPANQASDD